MIKYKMDAERDFEFFECYNDELIYYEESLHVFQLSMATKNHVNNNLKKNIKTQSRRDGFLFVSVIINGKKNQKRKIYMCWMMWP